jgi:predicted component of type VI protein secretion system
VRGSNIFGPVVDETRALLTLAAEGDIVVSEALVSDALEPVSSRASRIQDNAGPPRYRLQWRQPAAQSPADKAKPAADKAKPAAPAQAMAAVAERIEERAEATDGFAQGPLGQEAAVEPVVLESMSAVPEFEGSDSAEQAFEALPEEPVLVLRSADNTIDIVPDSGVFCIGRDANLNDWTFAKPVVSRSHLRIEFQEGIYVLQDCSSNGTYVSIDGEGEVHLLQDTMILQGHGLISLAVAARTDPELTIRFELHDTG